MRIGTIPGGKASPRNGAVHAVGLKEEDVLTEVAVGNLQGVNLQYVQGDQ